MGRVPLPLLHQRQKKPRRRQGKIRQKVAPVRHCRHPTLLPPPPAALTAAAPHRLRIMPQRQKALRRCQRQRRPSVKRKSARHRHRPHTREAAHVSAQQRIRQSPPLPPRRHRKKTLQRLFNRVQTAMVKSGHQRRAVPAAGLAVRKARRKVMGAFHRGPLRQPRRRAPRVHQKWRVER